MKQLPQKFISAAESSDVHLRQLYRQSEGDFEPKAYFRYVEMNQSRIRRLLKRDRWTQEEISQLDINDHPICWLVITEHWCGDAANSLPYMIQLADHLPQLNIKFVYRDDDVELIDSFLTNGGRSIPKVIAYEPESRLVLTTWGPRPSQLQEKTLMWLRDPEMDLETRAYLTQKWYIEDKGLSIKKELLQFYKKSMLVINSIDSMGKII